MGELVEEASDESHNERRLHTGRSPNVLWLAGCAAHAGALAERDAGAPVYELESNGPGYDDPSLVAGDDERLRTTAGYLHLPAEPHQEAVSAAVGVAVVLIGFSPDS